jgi:GTPase SAR1 family protein
MPVQKIDLKWIVKNLKPYPEEDDIFFLDYYDWRGHYRLDPSGQHLLGLNLATHSEPFELDIDWSQLEILYLRQTQLSSLHIPAEATKLRSLTLAESKKLKSLTFGGPLPELVEGEWSECTLESLSIPAGCVKLDKLFLARNELSKFEFLGDCPALRFLEITHNKLKEVRFIRGFQKLMYLYIGHNGLERLIFDQAPAELEILFLRGNKMDELPVNLYECKKLADLNLYDNPWKNIPPEMIDKDERGNSRKGIWNHLEAVYQKRVVENDEVKLILLGNSTAGKSTLMHYLQKGEYNEDLTSTHGIYGEVWSKPGRDFSVNVWDFGGQDFYHATHRLFLSKNAVALVVFEDKTNEAGQKLLNVKYPKDQGAEYEVKEEWVEIFPYTYWLDSLAFFSETEPGAYTLLVQSKMDEPQCKITDVPAAKLLKYQLPLEHVMRVSTKAAQNESTQLGRDWKSFEEKLFGLLAKTRGEFKIDRDIIRLKNAIREDKGGDIFFTWKQYEAFCENFIPGISSSNSSDRLQSITDYLHKTGILLHYSERQDLKDYVFVKPKDAVNLIYQVLDLKVKNENLGRFDFAHVKQVLAHKKLSAQQLIDLMKAFELIFVPLKHEHAYVAPQYLPNEFTEPKSYQRYKRACQEGFYLRFTDFLPRSIMARFICRYGELTEDDFCKNGISFEYQVEKGDSIATACRVLVETTEPLVIQVATERDDQVVYEGLFNGLYEIINSSNKDLDFELSRNGQDYLKLSLLKRREWKEEEMIITESGEFQAGDFAFAQQKLFRDHVEPGRSSGRMELPVPEIVSFDAELPSLPVDGQGNTLVLFASASTEAQKRLRVDIEARKIEEQLINAEHFKIKQSTALTFESLTGDLNRHSPQILHFSGHGKRGGIELETEGQKTSFELDNALLKETLEVFNDSIGLVVLNSCYSFDQAIVISELGIPVICMLRPIEDAQAINFSVGLYQALVNKRPLLRALASGKLQMKSQKDTPALWYKGHRIA